MIVKGITIHNTGNDLPASELYEILKKDNQLNYCHYLVDENEVINTLSEEYEAIHTGKGFDFGNRFTIAIEICRSQSDGDTYLTAEKNAVKLIKKLMKKYKLTTNDLYFHIDFNEQSKCPHRILKNYKTKENFINGYFV